MDQTVEHKKEKRQEIRVLEFVRSYGIVIFSWLLMISMLGIPEFTIVSSTIQVLILLLWTYFGHRLAHDMTYMNPINPHIFIHHLNLYNLPRWVNLLQEAIFNMSSFLIILVVQYILGLHLFSTSIVICTGLLYVLIHIGDYSIISNKGHVNHHKFHTCNYAPDFMDVLFNTRCEKQDEPYENHNIEIFHGIAAVAISFLLKNQYGLS